jgi:hypothetical protein
MTETGSPRSCRRRALAKPHPTTPDHTRNPRGCPNPGQGTTPLSPRQPRGACERPVATPSAESLRPFAQALVALAVEVERDRQIPGLDIGAPQRSDRHSDPRAPSRTQSGGFPCVP